MAKEFVEWLVEQAERGDRGILDRLTPAIDGQLSGKGQHTATERQRIATEFSRMAPNTALTKDMLAIIQAE